MPKAGKERERPTTEPLMSKVLIVHAHPEPRSLTSENGTRIHLMQPDDPVDSVRQGATARSLAQ